MEIVIYGPLYSHPVSAISSPPHQYVRIKRLVSEFHLQLPFKTSYGNFYVTLPRSTTDSVGNTLSHYVTKFPRPFELREQWVVALVEITTPTFWYNVDE